LSHLGPAITLNNNRRIKQGDSKQGIVCVYKFINSTRPLWSCGSWIYNYLCTQCLSPLTLRVPILPRWDVLNTILCDQVCQWLAIGQGFSLGIPFSSTNKTVGHDIKEILLKVALNTIVLTPLWDFLYRSSYVSVT
jgi:hypothetical protein